MVHLGSFLIMARKRKIDKPRSISVVVSSDYFAHLQRVMVRLSNHKGTVVHMSEAIRALLEEAFPMPKTKDMFEN